MADSNNFGFGKFVPGFDFLQNLAKGATQGMPQMPNLSSWIAPTVNVEDLQKRIDELKTVQFWLEKNSKAIGATVQALEVQKMTLSTLQGMNFSVGELAKAMQLKPDLGAATSAAASASSSAAAPAASSEDRSPPARQSPAPRKSATRKSAKADAPAAAAGVIDPMQWWGSLSQQFQQIAANAMKDAAKQTAVDATRQMASGMAKEVLKTATGTAKAMASTMGNAAGAATAAATRAAGRSAGRAADGSAGAARRTTGTRRVGGGATSPAKPSRRQRR